MIFELGNYIVMSRLLMQLRDEGNDAGLWEDQRIHSCGTRDEGMEAKHVQKQ